MPSHFNFSNYLPCLPVNTYVCFYGCRHRLTNVNLLYFPDSIEIASLQRLRQVLFDVRVENSNLAKSLSEESNYAMYQEETPTQRLAILAKLLKLTIFPQC